MPSKKNVDTAKRKKWPIRPKERKLRTSPICMLLVPRSGVPSIGWDMA